MSTPISQPTAVPTRKVTVFLVGTQISGVLVAVFAAAMPDAYAAIPDTLRSGLPANVGGIIGFTLAWFVRDRI